MYTWFSVSITYINRYIYIHYIHTLYYTHDVHILKQKTRTHKSPKKVNINVVHLTNTRKQLNQTKKYILAYIKTNGIPLPHVHSPPGTPKTG